MKKTTAFLIMLFFLGNAVEAQYTRYIVQFTNKLHTPYSLSNSSGYLSDRSLQRRLKQRILPDSTDLPIDPAYIDSITSVPGVILLNRSKWFNQVLVQLTDTLALSVINAFDFVKKTAPVALSARRSGTGTSTDDFERPQAPSRNSVNGIGGIANINSPDSNYYYYGNNYAQIHIHDGEYLHNNGFRGQGLQIAILDAGFFHYLSNPAFDSVRLNNQVLGTWDYVNNKQSVDEENDHGAFCFSIMAANEPGLIIGSAPKASYWLFKTEDVNSEYPVEEQNWVAAAEFADSAGVDLISTSLGYAYFDNASFNQVYTDRNGHGTLITQAANLAVAKG